MRQLDLINFSCLSTFTIATLQVTIFALQHCRGSLHERPALKEENNSKKTKCVNCDHFLITFVPHVHTVHTYIVP